MGRESARSRWDPRPDRPGITPGIICGLHAHNLKVVGSNPTPRPSFTDCNQFVTSGAANRSRTARIALGRPGASAQAALAFIAREEHGNEHENLLVFV